MADLLNRLRSLFSRRTTVAESASLDLPAVNDLARVVTRCNCPGDAPLGWFGTVGALTSSVAFKCPSCNFECACAVAFVPDFSGKHALVAGREIVFTGFIPRHWLRRVPPLSSLEAIDIHTELADERPREVMA